MAKINESDKTFLVTYVDFTNTTSNKLFIEHSHNNASKNTTNPKGIHVPVELDVFHPEHKIALKKLKKKLKKGDMLKIEFGYEMKAGKIILQNFIKVRRKKKTKEVAADNKKTAV